MPTNKPIPVELDELLAAEFDYIAQTAIQANEDRARVSSFYLVAVGSLLAAMFGTQLFDPKFFTRTVDLMFGGLFLLLTLLGTSTVMQLARLRMAWYESMMAMNQLKKYMMGENKSLIKAFRWTMDTLPPKYKRNSVSYYQAFEVALISGLMLGAAAFFVQQAFFSIGLLHWAIAILAGIITVFIQLRVYRQTIK
ncbi:MAG TPA: hypothetical protein VKP08_22555 [Anaerolineales bacterium]|nr:hypothetical protein [Anaerolineales bacterium]